MEKSEKVGLYTAYPYWGMVGYLYDNMCIYIYMYRYRYSHCKDSHWGDEWPKTSKPSCDMAHIQSLQSVGAIYQVSIKVAEHRVRQPISTWFFFHKLGYSKIQQYLSTSFSTRKSPEIRHSPFQLDPRQLGSTLDRYLNTNYFCLQHKIDSNWYIYIYMVGSINEGSPIAGWFIFFAMENPITMDDIEVSQF